MKNGGNHEAPPMVSSEPLRGILPVPGIGQAGRGTDMEGRRGFARRYADRYGLAERSAYRDLVPAFRGEPVSLFVADRIATLAGRHLGELYGWPIRTMRRRKVAA